MSFCIKSRSQWRAYLAEDSVGTDAGLPSVPQARGYDAGGSQLDICVVKDDEWRIAPQLHGHLAHLASQPGCCEN